MTTKKNAPAATEATKEKLQTDSTTSRPFVPDLKVVANAILEALNKLETEGPYAGVLQKLYPAKRKIPNRAGRMQLQWCWIRRSQLTDAEVCSISTARLQRGFTAESDALLEERGLAGGDV